MTPSEKRRRIWATGGLTAALLVGVLVLTAAAPAAATMGTPISSLRSRVLVASFSNAYDVFGEASVGVHSLSFLASYNGSYDLVLFDARTNSVTDLGIIPGGSDVQPIALTSAGGRFYLSVLNLSTSIVGYEQITTSGRISTFGLAGEAWGDIYGASHVFFVAGTSYLAEFNATTHARIANFSSAMPTGLVVWTMAGTGSLYYIGGSISLKGVHRAAWFGALNTATGAISKIFEASSVKAPADPEFLTIARVGGTVYLGGGIQSFAASGGYVTLSTDRAYLYKYSPATGKVTRLSGLLAKRGMANETVWSIQPWGKSIALYAGGYYVSTATGVSWSATHLYKLAPKGRDLWSMDAWLPAGFAGDYSGVMSKSGGFLFLGGSNSLTGTAELIAIQA